MLAARCLSVLYLEWSGHYIEVNFGLFVWKFNLVLLWRFWKWGSLLPPLLEDWRLEYWSKHDQIFLKNWHSSINKSWFINKILSVDVHTFVDIIFTWKMYEAFGSRLFSNIIFNILYFYLHILNLMLECSRMHITFSGIRSHYHHSDVVLICSYDFGPEC